jgi:hypothetical protein
VHSHGGYLAELQIKGSSRQHAGATQPTPDIGKLWLWRSGLHAHVCAQFTHAAVCTCTCTHLCRGCSMTFCDPGLQVLLENRDSDTVHLEGAYGDLPR